MSGNRFIDIDYDEITKADYAGVTVSTLTEKVATFFTGDVTKDFLEMADRCMGHPIDGSYVYMSSVDHFVMDMPDVAWKRDAGNGLSYIVRIVEPIAQVGGPTP